MTFTNTYLSKTYDMYNYKVFGPLTMFCHHAPIVLKLLNHEIADNAQDMPPLLLQVRTALTHIVELGPGPDNYDILGYNPNLCLSGSIVGSIDQSMSHDPDQIGNFLLHTFRQAALSYPLDYLFKVEQHAVSAIYQPLVAISVIFKFDDRSIQHINSDMFSDRAHFKGIAAMPLDSDVGIYLLKVMNKFFWCLLLVGCIMIAVNFTLTRYGFRSVIRRWAPAILSSGLLIGAIMVVAMSSTFDVSRYRYPLFPLVLGTSTIIILILVERVQAAILRMRFS